MSKWPSEIREFKDEKTGRTIKQLTAKGNNVHMYFTENSFDQHRNEIYFLSDRASGADKAPHEDPAYNLFRMNLDTGEMEQIADDDILHGSGSATKTPDSALVAYQTADSRVRLLDTHTGALTTLYEGVPGFEISSGPSIAVNRRYVAFCRNEISDEIVHYRGANYAGFKERYYMIKDGRITVANMDGSGWYDVFRDTHQLGFWTSSRGRRGPATARMNSTPSATSFGRRMASSSSTIAAPVTTGRSPRTARRR
jgi:oligogalacturonide lyase